MSVIIAGKTFDNGEQLTAEKLNLVIDQARFNASEAVDNSTLTLIGGAMAVNDNGITESKINNGAVTTDKITDSNVTKAKIEDVANMKVLGNTSGSAAAPEEVDILDEDDMSSNSATAISTQQSIKAYVDNSSTDGFSPTTYAGGESVTLPNGLIMKFGQVTAAADANTTVEFDNAFSGTINAQLTIVEDTNNDRFSMKVASLTNDELVIRNTIGTSLTVFWQAIGY